MTEGLAEIKDKILGLQVDPFLEDLCRQGIHKVNDTNIHDIRVNLQTLIFQRDSVRHEFPSGVTFQDLEVSEYGRYSKIIETIEYGLSRGYYLA